MKFHLFLVSALAFSVACSKNENKSGAQQSPLEARDQRLVVEEAKLVLEASGTRSESLSIINDEKSGTGTKIVAGREYFLAQNFQQVRGMSQENLEALYLSSVNDFLTNLEDIYSEIRVKRMSPLKKNGRNEEKAFYAIALTMDTKNKGQKLSFYDLIKQALINEANGELLAPHERLIVAGHNKQMIIDLLKARVDMTAAQGLKYLTIDKRLNLSQKTKKVIFEITGGMIGEVDLPETFSESSEITKDFAIHYMDESLRTKNFLREFAITKDLEKVTRSAYMNLELDLPRIKPNEELSEEEDLVITNKIKVLQDRKAEIRNLINSLLQ